MSRGARKPLYDAETACGKSTFCVTGGTGYIAGAIIERLLRAGHTVHMTCRDPGSSRKLAYLQSLPNAEQSLRIFKADLEDWGSFDGAVVGCEYVIHTASPVAMSVPASKAAKVLLEPAVAGVNNIVHAINKADSVKRLVVTSSVAAVCSDHWERGRHHVFTEQDWNRTASEAYLPYHRSKVLAERRAFELCKAQNRWSLVTILPSVVQGPPPGNVKCEVVGFMRKLMNGGYYPAVPNTGAGYVDLDDVAAAHCLAALLPEAQGRYIVSGQSLNIFQYLDRLRPEYVMYKLPFFVLPYWLLWLLVRVFGVSRHVDLNLVAAAHCKVPHFNTSKSRMELGLTYTDMRDSVQDMAASLLELGIIPRLPGAPLPSSYYPAAAKL